MRMWSRGLGRQNIGIELSEINVMSLDEALDYMLKEARKPLLQELDGQKVVTLSGKMLPPVGWEFVITMGFKDIIAMAWKLASWKAVKSLFLSSAMKEPVGRDNTEESVPNQDIIVALTCTVAGASLLANNTVTGLQHFIPARGKRVLDELSATIPGD